MGINFRGGRRFLVLLCSVIMGLVVLVFIPGNLLIKKQLGTAVNFEEVNFPSLAWKNQVIKNTYDADLEEDSNKRFELYSKVFNDILVIYLADHNPKTRIQLENLANIIAKDSPILFKKNSINFTIPCLDSGCGTANYPSEIENIKASLREVSTIEPLVLDSVLKKFEAAALSNDENFQLQNYLGAFQEIKAEKTRINDEKIDQIGLTLVVFLKAKYPAILSQREKDFPGLFEI